MPSCPASLETGNQPLETAVLRSVFSRSSQAPKPAPSKSAEAIWNEKPAIATVEQPSFDATETFNRHVDTVNNQAAVADPDHDVTSMFESETLKMDMDANDPVSEAEFHLAYGLYDEAALLLESAAQGAAFQQDRSSPSSSSSRIARRHISKAKFGAPLNSAR